jgi:hypothetical protein
MLHGFNAQYGLLATDKLLLGPEVDLFTWLGGCADCNGGSFNMELFGSGLRSCRMDFVLLGAISMASLIAGLFFLRFWKDTGDRFFLFFAVSF